MGTALNVSAWSTTASSNSGADSTIGTVADTSSPTSVDDWTRSIMAAVKKYVLDTDGGLTAGGTADALTLSTNRGIDSGHQAAGFSLRFKASATNTGATTVAVDGLSAVTVKRLNGDALSAGDIVSGGIYDIAFDGTNYILLGAGTGSGTYGTLSGDNTWSGVNVFSSTVTMNGDVTVGNASGDTVIIKGTTVNSYMSGLLSQSSRVNLRQEVLGSAGAITSLQTSDVLLVYDNSASDWRQITVQNFIRSAFDVVLGSTTGMMARRGTVAWGGLTPP